MRPAKGKNGWGGPHKNPYLLVLALLLGALITVPKNYFGYFSDVK